MFAPLLRKTDKEYIDNSGISLQKPENKIDWVKLFIKLLYIYTMYTISDTVKRKVYMELNISKYIYTVAKVIFIAYI